MLVNKEGNYCKKFGRQQIILKSSMEKIYGDKECKRISRES